MADVSLHSHSPQEPDSVRDAPAASSVSVRRIGKFLAAEVTNVDLRKPLDSQTVEEIRLAHAEHGVLVFPDQKISSEDLKRFGRYFGKLTVHPFSTNDEEQPELIVYDNKEGNPPPQTDVWHSDETFRECPPMGTALCSKVIPAIGGDTVFCSMEAAYEGLPDRIQKLIEGMEAIHDFVSFKGLFPNTPEGQRRLKDYELKFPPMVHPVVRVHPVTGRKSLFVNPGKFTIAIKGMSDPESRWLLDLLGRTVNTLEYHYRHRWVPDMVVFWDNRSLQHAAVHDYYPQQRKMDRITIEGDRPFGAGVKATEAEIRRRKVPSVLDFKDRPKRQFERG
jgi:taurine dioxygenase